MNLEQQILFSRKASKRLKSLKPVFRELRLVHQRYMDAGMNRDCPYWYSERPHTGLLAAAVWQKGGTALEEFEADKIRERKRRPGRCDLYIRINSTAFECEAKRLWLNLAGKKLCQKVNDWLNWAVADVKKLQSRKGLALCFVTPVIHKSKVHKLAKQLSDWRKLLKTTSDCDALIWIGTAKGQKLFGDRFKHPGLLLAVKEVR